VRTLRVNATESVARLKDGTNSIISTKSFVASLENLKKPD
jgi:hypothetical protein